MPDLTCAYTIYVPITAPNEDKANERLEEVQDMIQIVMPDKRNRPWLGDMEFGDIQIEEL